MFEHHELRPSRVATANATKRKKTDVAKHPEAFNHVGLLVNEPPDTAGLPFL